MPSSRLAYCSVCRGVLPFDEAPGPDGASHRGGLSCERCRTPHRRADPGRGLRGAALRHLTYSGFCGLTASALGAGMATLGAEHPLVTSRMVIAAWIFVALCGGCAARSIRLGLRAAEFESLMSWEMRDLDRRLCPGMIRSDVVDELSRRGWRIGKIRTALASMEPAPNDIA